MPGPRGMGWKPEPPDHRDMMYRDLRGPRLMSVARAAFRPRVVDLVQDFPSLWPEIFDQGNIGSCVAQAWVRAAAFCDAKQDDIPDPLILSRLALYYKMRELEGTVNEDSGAYIRDGAKAIARWGLCREALWSYNPDLFKVHPPDEAMAEGAHRSEGLVYLRVEGEGDILDCLAEGYPVVFGSMLFTSFFRVSAENDIVPMPSKNDRPEGGHAQCIVGYDRRCRSKLYKVANSWSPLWGRNGYSRFPFAYLNNRNLADDMWTIRRIAA